LEDRCSYLLGITIGPVQSYISESRKLSDLRNSSKIISDIMTTILSRIIKINARVEIIYPNCIKQDGIDCSNYAIIELEEVSDVKVDEVGNDISSIINDSCKKLKEIIYPFWAVEKIKDNNYDNAYRNLVALLQGIKNTYEFGQTEQESGEKCILCGKYNISKTEEKNNNLNTEDKLCELCLFKRNYGDSSSNKLSSVYSVAISKWRSSNLEIIKPIDKKLKFIFKPYKEDKYYSKNIVSSIIDKIKLERIDKKSKFIKELSQDLKSDIDLSKSAYAFEEIKTSMETIYGGHDENKIEPPTYEYCFIQMDVDNLGKWMSGKYIDSDYDEFDLKEYQKFISKTLTNFGIKLKQRLPNNELCQVIYSGGDDFLAVIPNEEIINVSEIIDSEFQKEVKNKIKEKYIEADGEITYSISITIAQCKDPMSYALSKTRMELDKVKARFESVGTEKNGAAITHIINNGKEITSYVKKDKLKRIFKLVKSFKSIKKYILFSYLNNFENEFTKFQLEDIASSQMQDFYAIANVEFRRLLLKSKIKIEDSEENKEIIAKIKTYEDSITSFLSDIINENYIEHKVKPNYVDFKNVINVLKINKKLCSIFESEGQS
jgi:CRISPR-associated protein Cmr2